MSQNGSTSKINNKLKLLAIHGYRQNAKTFKQKTGSFRKIVHKWADVTYITAPHKVLLVDNLDDIDCGQSKDEEQYGWFFNRDDKTYRGIRKGGPAIGFEDSLQLVEEIVMKYGPFDGILGFSQGACFVGLLCSLQHKRLINFGFKFAIMVSGFKSDCLPHFKYYSEEITIPTLHVFGETDKIIPTEMSVALSECFEDPEVITHPGGHYFPASAAEKQTYQKFFKLRILEKDEISNSPDHQES